MYTRAPWNTLRFWAVGAVVLALFVPNAAADSWNKKTQLTVHERVEVPGAILEPGEYVIRLVDSDANRHIVRILNEREDHVISTVIAIPNYRLDVTGGTEFAWYERPSGQARALRAWFYPGDNFGQEFVYPKRQAEQIAAAVREPVPAVADVEESVMKTQVKPEAPAPKELKEAEVRPYIYQGPFPTPQEPMRFAQARQPESEPDPMPASRREAPVLPETAGFGPLLGLFGVASLAAAAALSEKLRHGVK